MLKRYRIDSLLVFLVLSLVFLWIAFPQIKSSLFGNNRYTVSALNVEEQLAIPENGLLSGDELIRPFNSDLELHYSVDGGESFCKARGNQILLSEIENPNIQYRNTSIRWRHPKGEFPKLKSIVVKLRNPENKTESKVKELVFMDKEPGSLPVVHLTLPESDLFGWYNGIMIYGNESTQDDGFQKDWWYRTANFAGRGSEWGRVAMFHYFEDGKALTDQKCEIRISGNATRYFPQKSLKLFPLNETGKRDKINYRFWGEEGNKKSKSFLLRQSGNDNSKTLFADLLMHLLVKDSKVLVQNGFPVSVYVNGVYWGVYNLRERIDPYFIAKKEKVDDNEVTVLYCEQFGDRTRLKSGGEEDKKAFDELIKNLPDTDMTDADYDEVNEMISIKSFIDYILIESFYANQDWLYNNTTWYKAGDKSWKWLINDLDYSLAYPGTDNVEFNMFDRLKKSNSITAQLFNALITYPKFKSKFKERANEMVEVIFSETHIRKVFNDLKLNYESEIDQHINRWRFIDSRAQWEEDCTKNVTFLLDRRIPFLEQVAEL